MIKQLTLPSSNKGPFKYDLTPFLTIFNPPHPHTFYDFLYSDPHTFSEFPTPPSEIIFERSLNSAYFSYMSLF